ncbi:MAG: hypothetical protein Q4D79_05730 [Propionibacteriaceae bacterium]|nr:hypothetical protein [Propionibacteriaceae bacterium]
MERNLETSRSEATDALNSLAADRDRLTQHFRVPWRLMAAFGALGAWGVGAAALVPSGEGYEPPRTGWLALLGVLVVAYLVQRETGIRFRSMGAKATWLTVAAVVSCLVLFSVSLALISLELRWGVVLTSAVAFVVTTWLSGAAYRAAVEHLHRG